MFIQSLNQKIQNHAIAWDKLQKRLEADEQDKKDILTDDLCFEADGTLTIEGVKGYTMQPEALSQIISRFAPKGVAYLRHCLEAPELFAQNMNHWVYENLGKAYLVRTREQGDSKKVRAVLSQRYGVMDNLELFQTIQSTFSDCFVPVDMALSAAQFHLRLAHKEGRDISRYDTGDTVHGGIHFLNSETGAAALMSQVITYRLVCTNGMLSPEEVSRQSKRHLGHAKDMRQFLRQSLDSSFAQMTLLLQRLEASQREKLDLDEAALTIQFLGQTHKWSEALTSAIANQLMLEDKNKFGLIQAITAMARYQKPDDRLLLEQQAGSLLKQDLYTLTQQAQQAAIA